jgi:predicted nucleotidyltransferase
MHEDLSDLVGRKVDIVKRDGLMHGRNPLRRQVILDTARPVCVAV